MRKTNLARLAMVVLLALLTATRIGHAQLARDGPPVRIVIPSSPGGLSDPVVRFLNERLRTELNVSAAPEFKPGMGGGVAISHLKTAGSDGRTLMLANVGQILAPLLSKAPYDFEQDVVPVGSWLLFSNVLIVSRESKITSLKELIAQAKARPGTLHYGSSGKGQSHHLSGEMLAKLADIEIVHIPYKGSGPALTDLMGGHVQFMFANIPAVIAQIQSGAVRALAVTGARRANALPDVPTMQEAGLRGFLVNSWVGLVAPAGTPDPVVRQLNELTSRAWASAAGRELLESLHLDWEPRTELQIREFLQIERSRWATLIRDAKIVLD